MTTTSTPKKSSGGAEEVCIDLPGEAVQCTGKSDSYKVILRKHRDVIFDINQGDGKTYTVEATDSDFYNARDKKLVFAVRKGTVTFKDGERLPLRVSRGFKGALLLKSGGKLLMRVEPNELDKHKHGDDPKEKPAPIIIALGKSQATQNTATQAASSSAAPQQTMQIVEVKKASVETPKAIADFFTHGGEETAVDASGILTRNWLWAQIAGGAAYLSDNKQWITELWKNKFYLQKVVHKNVGARWYIVFKGNAGLREYLTATRYAVTNSKVLAITSGAGSAQSLRHASWDAAKGSVKKAGGLAVILTITLDTAEWLSDYEKRDPVTGKPSKDFFDLVAKIGVDLMKAGISAVLGTALMGLVIIGAVGAGLITAAAAVPIAIVIVGAIVFSIGVGIALDHLDKKSGMTDILGKKIREAASYFENGKHATDYQGYQDTLNMAVMP